jgi:exo-beta-1,3-glucanase (GH17 family)/cellulose synthase/poly-beta-1,6-N-acetylglucosamine synthase-like glycosyltransferase
MHDSMRGWLRASGMVVAAVFAAITFALWAYLNRPTAEPPWPTRVQGMAFSPFYSGQDPVRQAMPTEAEIERDLVLLSGKITTVRTYSSLASLGRVPEIAARHHIKVALGAWLDSQRDTNEKEIEAAIALANEHANVIRLVVGNEVILRGNLSVAELGAQLARVRASVQQPVSTAEPWHVWLKHPQLAQHVDFITVHMLPYWEGVHVEHAVDYIGERMAELEAAFPGKPIVIGEVGWPSGGRTREAAVASTSNEALFLRRFLQRARTEGYIYYLMEAFDQPWKARYEGAVGAYWGVYDVDRQPKFAFVEPIVRIPQWQTLAALSVGIASLLLGMFYLHSRTLGTRGRSLLAIVVYATATAAVWIIYDYSQRYLTFTSVIIGTLLIAGMLGVIAVLLAEAHEWAEAHWAISRRRAFAPGSIAAAPLPKVSIHVPAYNEPPQMVIETLDALARLDYPDYEVIVVDNNTREEAVWRPVEQHCARLGARFRFFHVDPLPGFKAGALNHALRHTAADARIIAVIDSDYQVDPHWLRDLVPALGASKVAIVQAPQDYRDDADSLFKAMCHAEYRGFFHIGMVTRNERNAIIQHGTMTLVRRDALEQAGGWAEWCITEDAELGLRLFEHGYEAQYLSRSYGRGLMPETFIDYKKQRFRWAYGAIQILRAHAGALLSPADQRLTAGQRYHFIAGWLPWLADGINLLFNMAAVAWSIAMISAPYRFDPPLMMFSMLPLTLFTFKLVKLAHLYVSRVGANIRQTCAAAIAGLALSHTIGVAVIRGALTRNEPFFRTPKRKQPHVLAEGFAAAREETLILLVILVSALLLTQQLSIGGVLIGVPEEQKGPDTSVWVAVLLIQAVPYAAALLVSLASALSLPARWLGRPVRARSAPVPEPERT